MNIWIILAILFGVSLIVSAIGFKKFLWFISIGYGFSIVGCGIAILVINFINGTMNITGLIATVLLMIYGLRLGGFLTLREIKSASYRASLVKDSRQNKSYPAGVKLAIWLTVALLYTAQTSGVEFVLNLRGYSDFLDFSWCEIVGVCLMGLGILQEGIADAQKNKYKKINPNLPAMKGLFRLQRCPNYSGEVMMWTGVLVFALSACGLLEWWMYIIIIIAYLSITYIMLNGAKRLEKRHLKNYAENEEAMAYLKKTPLIIIVFIPVMSLKNVKFII